MSIVSQYKDRNEGTTAVRLNRLWITPAVTNVFVDYPTLNSTHLRMGISFKNLLAGFGEKGKFEFIKISTILRMLNILGLMAVLSYMIVILFTWMYANIQGYVYFSAGEPVSLIKYPEWALGILGILAIAGVLRKELDQRTDRR